MTCWRAHLILLNPTSSFSRWQFHFSSSSLFVDFKSFFFTKFNCLATLQKKTTALAYCCVFDRRQWKQRFFVQLNVIALRCVEFYPILIVTGNNHSHVTVARRIFFLFSVSAINNIKKLLKNVFFCRSSNFSVFWLRESNADRRGNCQNKIKSDSIHVSWNVKHENFVFGIRKCGSEKGSKFGNRGIFQGR